MRNAPEYLVTAVAALCWGASGVSADYLTEYHGTELTLTSLFRMFVPGIPALVYVLARLCGVFVRHRELVFSSHNWRDLTIYAVFRLVARQTTYMGVIRASNTGTGTVLEYLGFIPIVVWVCLTHRRWPHVSEVIVIVLAVTGAFPLRAHRSLDSLVIAPTALAWGVVTALTLVIYILLSTRFTVAYDADVVVAYNPLIAGACVGLVGRVWRSYITWTPDVVFAMFSTVVPGIAVASTAFLRGVDRIGSVKASLIGSLEPTAATAFSTPVTGSSYTSIDIAGIALIAGAVVTISAVDLLRARRVTQ